MKNRSALLASLSLVLFTTTPAFSLQRPDEVVASLRAQAPAGMSGHATIVAAGNDVIANVSVSQATPDTDLKKFAADLAARVLGDQSSHVQRVIIVYEGSAIDRVKTVEISRSNWQSIKDAADAPAKLDLQENERATGDFKPEVVAAAPSSSNPYASWGQTAEVSADSCAPAEVAPERTKLVDRLEVLRKKGVGTQPYIAILNESESSFKSGDIEGGKQALKRLDASLQEQEKQLSSRSTVRLRSGVAQSVTYQPVPVVPPPASLAHTANSAAATTLKAGKAEPDLFSQLLGGHSITEFKGTESDLATELAKNVLAKTLGVDCPNDGPFLGERLRVATRIHELDGRKVDVHSYRMFCRDRIEALVLSKDPRQLRVLAENIKYIEHQIGLEQLASNKK